MEVKNQVWVGTKGRPARMERWGEAILSTAAGRGLFAAGAVRLSQMYKALGFIQRSAAASLWAERIMTEVGDRYPKPSLYRYNRSLIAGLLVRPGVNPLRDAYEKSEEAAEIRKMFKEFGTDNALRLRFPRKDDYLERQGDLLILKEPRGGGEKGVILLSYNDAFYRAAAMFHLDRLAEYYRIVLEPSFWGYQDPAILLFLNLPTDVIVQCQSRPDREFITEIGGNFVPVGLGTGDWVDPDIFSNVDNVVPDYDAIMIANWVSFKRHKLLFRELRKIKDRIGRVALVGFPQRGRTRADIEREARAEGVLGKLDIFENIKHESVGTLLRRSKVALMLTQREGANRAFYEAICSDVPVIVTNRNRGMNHDHINSATGMMAPDDFIGETILYVIKYRALFQPRAWALANTGAQRSSQVLNDLVREIAVAEDKPWMKGEPWTQDLAPKKNAPNAVYTHEADRVRLYHSYEALASFRRA